MTPPACRWRLRGNALLTATFPWYELKETVRAGLGAGLVYKRKLNRKGEDVGGIVPHVTLKSIANNEPPEEEVLVDRPEEDTGVTRVTGSFCFEATIPTPMEWDEETKDADGIEAENTGSFYRAHDRGSTAFSGSATGRQSYRHAEECAATGEEPEPFCRGTG